MPSPAVGSGDLPRERLVDAAARVERASHRLRTLRADATSEPGDRSSSTVAAQRAITVDGRLGSLRHAQVLRFVSGANIAAGRVPCGGCHRTPACSAARPRSTSSRAVPCPSSTPTARCWRSCARVTGTPGSWPGSRRWLVDARISWSSSWGGRDPTGFRGGRWSTPSARPRPPRMRSTSG